MDYKINDFEGPLDLLLHLIKESEMDIFEVNIVDIANQYLDFIHKMEEMNLNIASEYLIMAAELMEIKSSILLPKKEVEYEDEYEEDPREQLINRLIEYEKYKNITSSLREYEHERQYIHSKEPYDLSEIVDVSNELDENFDINDLVEALNKMLARKEFNKPLNTKVATKEYSVHERSVQIKNILKNRKKIEFTELFMIISYKFSLEDFDNFLESFNLSKSFIKPFEIWSK